MDGEKGTVVSRARTYPDPRWSPERGLSSMPMDARPSSREALSLWSWECGGEIREMKEVYLYFFFYTYFTMFLFIVCLCTCTHMYAYTYMCIRVTHTQCACMCMWAQMCQNCTHGDQRTTWRLRPFPSIMLAPGTELRLSVLVTSHFIHWAILLVQWICMSCM